MRTSLRLLTALAMAAVATPLATSDGAAQVPAAEARAFIGDWNVAVQGEMPTTIRVNISEAEGNLAAVVTGMEGNNTTVQNISKSGENLVLRYDTSIQGQQLPIAITLTPDGDGLRANLDLAGGMMIVPGRGTKR